MIRYPRFLLFVVWILAMWCFVPVRCADEPVPTEIVVATEVVGMDTTVENTVETVETFATEVTEVTEPDDAIPYYTVNGAFLGYELSNYLYEQLKCCDMEWFYEIALCQLYQESRFDANAVSGDGYDQGIAQFRSTYFEYFMELAGLTEADPFNAMDSIYIYVRLMQTHLNSVGGDANWALSKYNVGNTTWYNHNYVNAVLRWFDTLEVK